MTYTDRFEDRLLQQLLADLPQPPPPPPAQAPARRRLATVSLATLASAAVATVVGVLAVNPANAAYALQARSDGSFAAVLYSTDPADLASLEADLQDRGARIELVPDTLECLDVLNGPLLPTPPHEQPSGPPSPEDYPEFHAFAPVIGEGTARRNPISGGPLAPGETAFIVRPQFIPADQVLWVSVAGANTEPATLVLVAQFAPTGAAQPHACTGG